MPNCCSKVDDSRHGDSITQSRALAAFVSLSLKARRPSGVKPEARLFCCFKALHPLCLEKSVCVFALCCLLWEHCCRWGLLTELKLSFHSGGMEEKRFVFLFVFCQSVCVCFSLPLFSLPTPPSLCPRHHTPPPPFPFPIWAHFLHLSAALFMLWCRSGLGRGTAKNKAG